jgi:hypothetical protein
MDGDSVSPSTKDADFVVQLAEGQLARIVDFGYLSH